jgi:hypothetical protein
LSSQHESLLRRIESDVMAALDRGERATPVALAFLLRRYVALENADRLAETIGQALADALSDSTLATRSAERVAWLDVFVTAASFSDDPRLPAAIQTIVAAISRAWGAGDARDGSQEVETCLRAAGVAGGDNTLIVAAIDELERIVSVVYRPGADLPSTALDLHVSLASALLTAFAIAARIPYAMLAEELMQAGRRAMWDERAGLFVAPFAGNCAAARVLKRLGALHRNAEYTAAAVIAAGADYDGDASRIIESLSGQAADRGLEAAVLGLAMLE